MASAKGGDVNNDQAPPSSAEEAAALLGAAISFDAPMTSQSATGHVNPPQGMHSIFTVQAPVPNQVLFTRLINLRAWLRWHAGSLEDPPDHGLDENANLQLGITFPATKRNISQEPFNAARSILAVLMKLLEASSAIGNGWEVGSSLPDDPTSKVVKSLSPTPKQKKHLPSKNAKQHKPLPPLLSTPLRNVWVECISLCLALGCSLPGNLRTDVNSVLGKMMEISSWNPRSKMAAGGVRLSTLQVVGQVCVLNDDLARRTAPNAWEILQCCHKGLLSGGAGEPGHRAACVKTACCLLVSCRRAAKSSVGAMRDGGNSDSFAIAGALEDRVAVEAIKFIKKGVSDRYPEVRMGVAVFAGLAAPMLIRNVPSFGASRGAAGKDADASPLAWLEDVAHLAMRNIDDESAGVATAWSGTLARCLCASAEYGQSVRDAQSEDQASKRSVDVDDEAPANDNANLDIAAKLKAFSESRRAMAATTACSSVPSAVVYLVSQFVKCGGETVSNRCGGSFSIGGRASRIGWSDTLMEFLRLQVAKGSYPLAEALYPVLEMVGSSFEKQIRKREGGHHLLQEMDFYAPSSPRSPNEKKPRASSMFLATNPKTKSAADSSIGRLLASNVLRKGLSVNLSESSQLKILRELTSACRASVGTTAVDGGTGSTRAANVDNEKQLNRHQLQVALVEISHLIVALGEAGASSLEDLLPVLRDCLSYTDHGVRHEAAAVYAAIAQAFPSEGRVFIIESLGTFGANLDAIQSLSQRVAPIASPTPRNRFRRSTTEANSGTGPADELIKHQSTLHGNSSAVSMLCHEAPHMLGGVATAIVSKVFDVVAKLLQCQFNDSLVKSNPSAACTCIRAGYCMLSGVLSMGIEAIVPNHVTTVFTYWQKSALSMLPGVSKLSTTHDLLWVETMLASIVSFLKFSPTLLLAVPDALTRLTAILDKVLPLISSGGRFEREAVDPVGGARLSSARSSVMEAYSWLPPGSFPLSADRIFSFAAAQIQDLSMSDVLCSVLDGLVSREDKIIEAHSIERAVGPGQIGGSVTLDNNITIRSSDVVHHNEREAVLHLLAWRKKFRMRIHDDILSLYLREGDENSIPTPLHEVGTWRVPPDPTGTSKVRLLDSSIHVFAATFGLQDGHTQSEALKMLEQMYFWKQTDKATRFNVSSSLIAESQGKVKPQEEDVPASNVIATVLACLQALPLHESTYDTLIDRGPPWMEKATSLLLRLLPSPSGIIRHGAAEGLSLLATLGVSEDAHTLQSTILHSLDEVMKGSNAGANPKTHTETLAFAKAGSLLTLACIQRAAKKMKRNEEERAVSRSVSRESDTNAESDKTPVMIMMTRVLPSLATQNLEDDSLLARTYALHSFGILIANSVPHDRSLGPEQIQTVWKAAEAAESSFLNGWAAVISENSKGKEREKFASAPAFLAVLLRLMTTLLPWLGELKNMDRWLASRFSSYAATMLEYSRHPAVIFEGSVFYERLSAHSDLVEPNSCCVVTTHNTSLSAMPFLISVIQPPFKRVAADSEIDFFNCQGPLDAQRSAVLCLKMMCSSSKTANDAFTLGLGKALFTFLHDRCGRRRFEHFSELRSLALSRAVVNFFEDCQMLESEVISLIEASLNAQLCGRDEDEKSFIIIQWLLLSRCLASGDASRAVDNSESESSIPVLIEKARFAARLGASIVLKYSNPPRWQLKCVSTNIAAVAMMKLLRINEESVSNGSLFNLKAAKLRCIDMLRKEDKSLGPRLYSLPIFHLEELVTTACSTSTATSNNSELPSVQIAGLRFLISLISAFGSQMDASTNDEKSVLEQYSSQIMSSVKHALNSQSSLKDSVPGTGFHRLFSAGCDALYVMISADLISDPIAMRRLLQPVMFALEELPFVGFPREGVSLDELLMNSSHVTDDYRSYPLFRLAKLSFAAKASGSIKLRNIQQSTISLITSDLEKDEVVRAVHCAAAAIDGFLLEDSQHGQPSFQGLTFKNVTDLDETVIQMLVDNWKTLGVSAISSMVKAVKALGNGSEERKSLQQWIFKLTPAILSGMRNSLSSLQYDMVKSPSELSSVSEVAALCIYAIRLLAMESESVGNECLCSAELGDIANLVTEVVFDILGLGPGKQNVKLLTKDHQLLVQQSCGLLEDLCHQHCTIKVDISILTRSVVTPLVGLQEKLRGEGAPETSHGIIIISSCIRSSMSLFQSHPQEGRAAFEKALVQLVMAVLKDSSELAEEIKASSLSLLRTCCGSTLMSHKEWGQIANYSATCGMWDAWSVVCSVLPPGHGIKYSIDAIKASLGDLQSGPRHTAALVALRTSLHTANADDPSLLPFTLQYVGCEILQLLRGHGVRLLAGEGFDENRTTVCAEAVKVNIMAFQYLNSMSEEEGKFVSFTLTLFEVLVEIVSFNGLPNHPSGKKGGDEAIGKMCAQVFVHVARTTPMLFKSTMAAISPSSKSVLEAAVRADMSGYAAPKRVSKKISLKGFVR
ncbi:hypothetical protein ACHAWF_016747 [Thalassiosira exigua]